MLRVNALLVFDLGLDGVEGVGGLYLQSDCFSGECLDVNFDSTKI
jgi:hypothetical protein